MSGAFARTSGGPGRSRRRAAAARALRLICGCAVLAVGPSPACSSRSPFRTSPAALAVREPCRYLGTVHKESRARLETLRMCRAVSADEWLCMARALESLDDHFTDRCRSRRVRFGEIAAEQRRLGAGCFARPDPALIECGIVSTDERCLHDLCEAAAARASGGR